METTIRVMLVEDSPDYREVIKLVLDGEPGIELVGQFGTSEGIIRALEAATPETSPDVILLDLRLPGMDGLDAIPQLRAAAPEVRIIILTQSNQEQDVLRAITLGAAGYLLKSTTLEELAEGIRTVHVGGASLEGSVAKLILQKMQSTLTHNGDHQLLSERELEVLTLIAEGKVKKEIAKQLDISYTTVDTHVGRIYLKLNVSNAPAAVDKAHRLNLLPHDGEELEP